MALMFVAALVAILVVLFQKSNSDGIQGITLNGVWPFFGYCTIAAETAE